MKTIVAICHFELPVLISLISQYKNCVANELEKIFKKEAIPKDFIKQPVIKQSSTFSAFLFSLSAVWVFFLFPYQNVNSGENLKILI